ncbi:MAG: phosphohydrolase [Treponema sp. RIFOXYC1_FULL_61_9]|nr:MAG: phosphohydrolase [Treponema sp. RIFOXYC1_FULL_61_9]
METSAETPEADLLPRDREEDDYLQKARATFASNPFPVLLLSERMRIEFANEACERLFTDYYRLSGNLFSDAFGKALGAGVLHELYGSVHSREKGYSWKGLIRSKTRGSGTVLTKAYLFPLYSVGSRSPSNYIAFFDDVTTENKNLLRSVFLSLLEASKLKDNDTGKHIQRVNLYARRFAEILYDQFGYQSIDRDFIEDIGFLASMHDVGKIGTPDDILNKEGPLAEWEWSIMQEHTKNGAYILSTYPNPMAREIALNHHERWDGTGYPFKIENSMIPLSARIVSIADVYDALRMKRSYKEAFDHATAIENVKEWSGSHFDPALVDVFERIDGEFEKIYEENAD